MELIRTTKTEGQKYLELPKFLLVFCSLVAVIHMENKNACAIGMYAKKIFVT